MMGCKNLRENVLHWNSVNGSLTVSKDVADQSIDRAIPLSSTETFEDRFFGLIHYITDISYEIDNLFNRFC